MVNTLLQVAYSLSEFIQLPILPKVYPNETEDRRK